MFVSTKKCKDEHNAKSAKSQGGSKYHPAQCIDYCQIDETDYDAGEKYYYP